MMQPLDWFLLVSFGVCSALIAWVASYRKEGSPRRNLLLALLGARSTNISKELQEAIRLREEAERLLALYRERDELLEAAAAERKSRERSAG